MAKKPKFDYDLIVIGSGAGGSAAATIAARAGKKVAIVEANTFGGESPNRGDVPRRAFMHAALVYDEARAASRFGLRTSTIGYNYPSLQQWKELVVKRTGAGNNRRYYEKQGVTTFAGAAHFLSPHEITINRRHLSAERFLVATGSHYSVPDIVGLSELGYLTPHTIFDLTRPPKSLYIIGGGGVALELAQLMAIFGTKVYIAEVAARLLPKEDTEVGELMEQLLHKQKGVISLTQTRTLAVEKAGLSKRVTYTRGGVEKSVRVDEVLVATGRMPNVDLGLENASVAYTPKGIEVNDHLQTTARHIYAAGDVLGKSTETHTALLQSRVAAHNLFNKNKAVPDYTATPHLTFTAPAIASVGLSEDDCLRRDLAIKVAMAPLSIIVRSNTSDYSDGFVKIVTDRKGVILGATVVSPAASEIIHELALAVKYELTAAEVADTPHAFLSWSEAVRVAAGKLA